MATGEARRDRAIQPRCGMYAIERMRKAAEPLMMTIPQRPFMRSSK